jgi:hypothetical protein
VFVLCPTWTSRLVVPRLLADLLPIQSNIHLSSANRHEVCICHSYSSVLTGPWSSSGGRIKSEVWLSLIVQYSTVMNSDKQFFYTGGGMPQAHTCHVLRHWVQAAVSCTTQSSILGKCNSKKKLTYDLQYASLTRLNSLIKVAIQPSNVCSAYDKLHISLKWDATNFHGATKRQNWNPMLLYYSHLVQTPSSSLALKYVISVHHWSMTF